MCTIPEKRKAMKNLIATRTRGYLPLFQIDQILDSLNMEEQYSLIVTDDDKYTRNLINLKAYVTQSEQQEETTTRGVFESVEKVVFGEDCQLGRTIVYQGPMGCVPESKLVAASSFDIYKPLSVIMKIKDVNKQRKGNEVCCRKQIVVYYPTKRK